MYKVCVKLMRLITADLLFIQFSFVSFCCCLVVVKVLLLLMMIMVVMLPLLENQFHEIVADSRKMDDCNQYQNHIVSYLTSLEIMEQQEIPLRLRSCEKSKLYKVNCHGVTARVHGVPSDIQEFI